MESNAKYSANSNIEILETIHVRYLEEIKNLNMNLQQFRSEKETEIKTIQEKNRLIECKYNNIANEKEYLKKKLDTQKDDYEKKI